MTDTPGDLEPSDASNALMDEMLETLGKFVHLHNDPDKMANPLVDQAMVIWEQVGINEDGDVTRVMKYACISDNFAIAGMLGLIDAARHYVRRDILGSGSE